MNPKSSSSPVQPDAEKISIDTLRVTQPAQMERWRTKLKTFTSIHRKFSLLLRLGNVTALPNLSKVEAKRLNSLGPLLERDLTF